MNVLQEKKLASTIRGFIRKCIRMLLNGVRKSVLSIDRKRFNIFLQKIVTHMIIC